MILNDSTVSSIAYSTNKNNRPNNDVVNIRKKKTISDGSNCIKKIYSTILRRRSSHIFFFTFLFLSLVHIQVYIILE